MQSRLAKVTLCVMITLWLLTLVPILVSSAEIPCTTITVHPSVDVASYDFERAGSVIVQGCQFSGVDIVLYVSRAMDIVVRDVTVMGGSFTVMGSPTSDPFPPGSRLRLFNVSTTACRDCFSVISSMIANFSLLVADSTIYATSTAVSVSSLRATQCSISVLRSLVSVASPSQPTYSACVFSADSLHVSQLELTASDSVLQSVSSKRSCSLSVVAGTQQNVLDTTIAVTRSDVTAVAKAAACCASIVSASSNQVTNLTIHAVLTHCNARADADAVAACMGVTSTISFVIATQLDSKSSSAQSWRAPQAR